MEETMTTPDTEQRTFKQATKDMRIAIEAAEPRQVESPEHYAELLQKLNKSFERMVHKKNFEVGLILGANKFLHSLRDQAKDKDLSLDQIKVLNDQIEVLAELMDF